MTPLEHSRSPVSIAVHIVFILALLLTGAAGLFVYIGSQLFVDEDAVIPASERWATNALFGSWFVALALMLGFIVSRARPMWSGLTLAVWVAVAFASFAVIFTSDEPGRATGSGTVVLRFVDPNGPDGPVAIPAKGICVWFSTAGVQDATHPRVLHCDGDPTDVVDEIGVFGVPRLLPGRYTVEVRLPLDGYDQCELRDVMLGDNVPRMETNIVCTKPAAVSSSPVR